MLRTRMTQYFMGSTGQDGKLKKKTKQTCTTVGLLSLCSDVLLALFHVQHNLNLVQH